jgi:biotin carboxyl carrier protein
MPERQQPWKIKSNDFIFSIDEPALTEAGIVQTSPTEFNCIKDNRSVNVFIIDDNSSEKKLKVEVEGEIFDIEIKDTLDQMLDEMGFSKALSKQIKEIKAPMPGMVLEITVKEGQEVKEGDKLLILGAMKMENSITISTNAVIKRIAVKAGQAVDKGQVLVELE